MIQHMHTHRYKSSTEGSCRCTVLSNARALVRGKDYRVAKISRLLKIVDLFCKRALLKRLSSAKETYNLKSLLIVATP